MKIGNNNQTKGYSMTNKYFLRNGMAVEQLEGSRVVKVLSVPENYDGAISAGVLLPLTEDGKGGKCGTDFDIVDLAISKDEVLDMLKELLCGEVEKKEEKIIPENYRYEVTAKDKMFKVSIIDKGNDEVYDCAFGEHIFEAVGQIAPEVQGVFPEWFGDEIDIGHQKAFIIVKEDDFDVAISRSGHKYMLCNIVGCACEGVQVIPKGE